jgi:hypothetical protein
MCLDLKNLIKTRRFLRSITLDKNIYFYLKKQEVRILSYINQMLKVALDKGSRGNDDFYEPNPQTLVRLKVCGLQFPRRSLTGFAQLTRNGLKIKNYRKEAYCTK